MENYITLFRIVPIKDGYHYVCKDSRGQHYHAHKVNNNLSLETLYFINNTVAQQYIDKYLEKQDYKPELILLSTHFAPKSAIEVVE
jgi:hypothetical protein